MAQGMDRDAYRTVSRWTVNELTKGERAVLLAIRRWFRSGTTGAMSSIRETLRRAGVPSDTLLPLFALLGVLEADRAAPVAVQAPDCAALAMDEARLLDALAAAQIGEEDAALDVLDHWLSAVAACTAVGAARDLGALLARSGIHLPGGRSGAGFGLEAVLAAE